MKRLAILVSLLIGVPGAVLASGWESPYGAVPATHVSQTWSAPYGPPLVVTAHDREPWHEARGDKDVTSPDNECNENHNLQPDGDADCDDPPVKGVPEPGPLVLLATGLVALIWRRRR